MTELEDLKKEVSNKCEVCGALAVYMCLNCGKKLCHACEQTNPRPCCGYDKLRPDFWKNALEDDSLVGSSQMHEGRKHDQE